MTLPVFYSFLFFSWRHSVVMSPPVGGASGAVACQGWRRTGDREKLASRDHCQTEFAHRYSSATSDTTRIVKPHRSEWACPATCQVFGISGEQGRGNSTELLWWIPKSARKRTVLIFHCDGWLLPLALTVLVNCANEAMSSRICIRNCWQMKRHSYV